MYTSACSTRCSPNPKEAVRRRDLLSDLANRSKHCALTSTWTGDLLTGPSGNDVTVMVGQGAKHAFRVSSGRVEWDALDLALACVTKWRIFLAARGLP